jgi:hypothetical protein
MDFSEVGLKTFAFCGRFSVDFAWILGRFCVDSRSILGRFCVDFLLVLARQALRLSSLLRGFCVDLGRFSVDSRSIFCPFSVEIHANWPKPSLSGVVNPGLQIAFQKRGQKGPKIVLKHDPQRVCTIHPDLPAGTPCYNFTGPTRNTV